MTGNRGCRDDIKHGWLVLFRCGSGLLPGWFGLGCQWVSQGSSGNCGYIDLRCVFGGRSDCEREKMLGEFDADLEAKLKAIYEKGDALFPNLSDDAENKKRHKWYKSRYDVLGVSDKDWLLFMCDQLGIVDISVD